MKFNLGLSNQISRTFQELKMSNSKFLDSGLCTKNECSSCFNFFYFLSGSRSKHFDKECCFFCLKTSALLDIKQGGRKTIIDAWLEAVPSDMQPGQHTEEDGGGGGLVEA